MSVGLSPPRDDTLRESQVQLVNSGQHGDEVLKIVALADMRRSRFHVGLCTPLHPPRSGRTHLVPAGVGELGRALVNPRGEP